MQKNIGSVLGLYPTPSTVVGTVVGGTVNWSNIAHIGIVGLDCIMLSIRKGRHTTVGIRENKAATVNLVSKDMIEAADYVGIVSGKQVDKSTVFQYHMGDLPGTPIIDCSPLVMECELVDIYDSKDYDNFILKVVRTYVNENHLSADGKPDYEKIRPILFEMPTKSYLHTGTKVGNCWSDGKDFGKKWIGDNAGSC